MMLRPGKSGANTDPDHLAVIADALAQLPRGYRPQTLIRIDGAGASYDLIEHLLGRVGLGLVMLEHLLVEASNRRARLCGYAAALVVAVVVGGFALRLVHGRPAAADHGGFYRGGDPVVEG
jgi:hypothetical protein